MTKLLDCTIRDGGYLNNWNFSFEFVYRLLRVLDESGFDYAEVGFWNPKDAGIPWRHCDLETLHELNAGTLGLKLVLLMDFGSCTVDDVPVKLQEYVGLIRVAAHKKNLTEAADFAWQLKQKGFHVTVNAMGITSYSKADLVTLASVAHQAKGRCDFFYLADSFGALTPEETSRVFHLLATIADVPLGFHPHNNLELAVANTLTAIGSGAAIIDSSVLGIGRGGGNLRSEVIAAILSRNDRTKVNPLPILSFADATFDQIGKDLGLCYDLEQVISGMAACHPNYASALIGPRRLALDEIYHVIESIPVDRKGQFSEANLEEVIAVAAGSSQRPGGVSPVVLNAAQASRAILVCPGALMDSLPSFEGIPVYSVNFIPKGLAIMGAIFGSLRRLWQNGDHADGATVYLAWNQPTQKSVPPHEVIDAVGMEAKVGKVIQNSGVRALALLLEAGFNHVDVYGMSGFSVSGNTSDGPDAEFVDRMNHEALVELRAVASAYVTDSSHAFTLHDSPLQKLL